MVQEEVMLIAHRVVKLVELTGMMKIVYQTHNRYQTPLPKEKKLNITKF